MNVQVYEPSNGESVWSLISAIFRGLISGHGLGFRLFIRDLKAGLEASLLGYAWTLLPALASAGLWIFLNDQRVFKMSDTGMPYPAYVLIGTTFWALFAEAVNKPIQRYKNAMSMMVKLNFPREAMTVAAIYDMMFSLTLKMLVLFVILFFLNIPVDWSWIGALPIALGTVFVGLSIGLIIAPFGILFNDISRGINLLLPFFMYLTPVVYIIQPDSFLGQFQVFNPVSTWISHARWMIGGVGTLEIQVLMIWSLVALMFFILGLLMLRIALPIIVERSGS